MGIGIPELILILIIGLVIFGPGKLPDIGKAVGKSLNEFKKASSQMTSDAEKTPELKDDKTTNAHEAEKQK